MGQYYRVITLNSNGIFKIYNRSVIIDGIIEYTPAKLTEHSWWLNPFVNAICKSIYHKKKHVAWLGDYSNDFIMEYTEGFNGISQSRILDWHGIVWGEIDTSIAVKVAEFTLENKYLVNHTKKQFIDGSAYFDRCVMKSKKYGDWCMHPLPLLTCIGNGYGGGDYLSPTADSNEELVGAWTFDLFSIEDKKPQNYKEIKPIFKEVGWEE